MTGDFARSASGQHQQDRRRRVAAGALGGVGPQIGGGLDQGVAHVGAGRAAQLLMRVRLEREQRQQVINVTAHRARAPRSPRPDGRRHVVDDRNIWRCGTHASCNPVGEVRAVDNHQHIGTLRHHRLRGFADSAQQHRQAREHGVESNNRKLIDRKQAFETLLGHVATADAGKLDGPSGRGSERLHQAGAEAVARFLARHQENPQRPRRCGCIHDTGPPSRTPATKILALSASAITRAGSTMMTPPATTARPARPAAAMCSTVDGPTVGRSKRRS